MTDLQISIRQGRTDDLTTLQELFWNTITTVCKADYTEKQIKVWRSGIENKERWLDILTNQFLLVAQDQTKIIGFCSLDKGNYIDLLYVHKDYQRQGIANKLYTDIEKAAIKLGQTQLISDVSITAKPFFGKVGFKVIAEQTVAKQDIELTNFKMLKELK